MPLIFDENQRVAFLKSKGYDPGWYDIEPNTGNIFLKQGPLSPASEEPLPDITKPVPAKAPTLAGSASRGFLSGIVPSLAGMGGIKGGAMIGQRIGSLGGPIGAGIGTVAGGIGGGIASSAMAAKLQDYLMPDSWREQLAQDANINPLSTLTGQVGSGIVGFSPSISNLGNAAKTVGKLGERALVGSKLARPIASGEFNNLLNVGGGAGLGAAQSLYEDYRDDESGINIPKLLLSSAGGALLSEPNKAIGQRIFKFSPTVGTIPDRDAASRLNPSINRMLAEQDNLATLAPDLRNQFAMKDLLSGVMPEGYDVNVVNKSGVSNPKKNIIDNILPPDLYEKGTPSAQLGGKLRKKDQIIPLKSAEESAGVFEEAYKLDPNRGLNPQDINKRITVLENQLKAATEQNIAERKAVTTPRNRANTKELNYQAYKKAMASGKFAEAKFYKQLGFEPRYQAENRGEVVTPFDATPESNLAVKSLAPSGEDALGRPIKRSRGTYFQENNITPDVEFDSAKRLKKLAEDNKVPLKVTKGIYDLLTKEFSSKRGVDFELNPRIKSRGEINLDTNLAKINPETATPDTIPHETFHAYLKALENSPNKSDKDLAEFVKNIAADSPEYRGLNARRQAAGMNALDVEEFLTESVGYDAVRRLYNLDKQTGTVKSAFKDFISRVKLRFGGGNIDDASRIMSERLLGDEGVVKPGSKDAAVPKNDIEDDDKIKAALDRFEDETNVETQDDSQGLKPNTNTPATRKYAPVTYKGFQEGVPGVMDGFHLYNLTEDLPNTKLVKGSTVTEKSLNDAGYEIDSSIRKQDETQGLDAGDFYTVSSKLISNMANGDTKIDVAQLRNTIFNKIPPIEVDLLKAAGIEKLNGKMSPKEMLKWIKENGPKVKIESYGMEGKVSEAKQRLDTLHHEWFDNLPEEIRRFIKKSAGQYNAYVTDSSLRPEFKTAEFIDKANEFIQLSTKVAFEPKDTSPRATSAYSSVSTFNTNEPMPNWTKTKSKNNVQRVDVVLPMKYPDAASNITAGEKPLWQPDNLHENLPNTLGWAMIQYKTGAKGEKIAVVAEAQSRWGQAIREQENSLKDKANELGITTEELGRRRGYPHNKPGHPLLKDYNRLILKAAIDQARKEGAERIVISDAETAMMTEGHDTVQGMRHFSDYAEAKAFSESQGGTKIVEAKLDPVYNPVNKWSVMENAPQSPGMRLNYDTILPKIMEEITGQKGERVELGQHKNAFNGRGETFEDPHLRRIAMRQNLIFKNADGSPKTSVSGLSYDITKAPDRYSLTGKRYQNEGGQGLEDKPDSSGKQNYKAVSQRNRKWYVGNVHQNSEVRAVENRDATHPQLVDSGFNLGDLRQRWRYDPNARQIVWSDTPTEEAKNAVENFLYRKEGITTAKHSEWLDGAKYQTSSQGLTSKQINDNIQKNKVSLNKGFFSADDNALIRNLKELPFGIPGLKSDITKLELRTGESGKYAAPNFRELFAKEAEYNGRYTNPALEAQKGLSDKDKDILYSTMLAEKRSGKTLKDTLPANLIPAYEKHRELFELKQNDQIAANQPVVDISSSGGTLYRKAKIDPYYFPEVTGGKQIDTLLNKQGSEDFNRLKNDFIAHVKNKYNVGNTAANELFQDMLASYGGPIKADSTRFGAVRKAEGIGLPDSWLETDMDTVLRRYWRRVSKDRSFHDTIESDDNMLHIMGRKYNPWGKEINPSKPDMTPIPGNDILSGILNTVQGINVKSSPRLDALSRIVNNLILGPITGANDAVNAIPLLLKFSPSLADVPEVVAKSIMNVRQGIKNAKSTGRIRENLAAIEDGFLPYTDSVERLRSFASTLNKVSGRDALEQFSRGLSQAGSEAIIEIQQKLAAAGNDKAKSFLTDLANGKDYTKLTSKELASRIVDLAQGGYDVRGLPSWVIDSPVAPILRLAKWNIEQLNTFHKHVLIPASKGNFVPLLTTLAGGTVGGMLAKELREAMANKESQIPSWAEIAASDTTTEEKLPAIAYNFAAALSYSGVLGTLGEMSKAAFDVAFENKPQGYNYPTIELLSDAVEKTYFAAEALASEESPLDVLPAYAADMFGRNIQLGRIGYNWMRQLAGDKAMEATADRRNLRVFRQLEGAPVTATGEQSGENPYVGLRLKKFKQSADLNESLDLGKQLVGETFEKYKDEPYKLKSELSKLKRNNFQTVPSPERNPILFKKYYDYMVRLNGEDEARKKLSEYFSQRALNQVKSRLVP